MAAIAPIADPLAPFSPAVRDWFRASFEAPTDAQARGWAAIASGQHTLIHAPTGSGKTLAAFLWTPRPARDAPEPDADPRDARRRPRPVHLAAQGADLRHRAQPARPADRDRPRRRALGEPVPRISVASRTGDTPAEDRRQIARHPPDILITTPESLYLMLTSAAREVLRSVEHVIVDEVHAIAGSKRGAHLALSLERLEALRAGAGRRRRPMQRIGLSATQRPLETIARFLGGTGPGREVTIVDAGARKPLDLQVVVPVDDMAALGEILPLEEQPGGPATARRHADEHLAGDPPADPRADPQPSQHDRLHQQPAALRTARPAAQRARRRGARPRPPRQRRPRAARRDRGGAQGRPAARAGRHVQPRARHRHGRGRPRHPGREPDERRARPAARRPGRPPGRSPEQGRHLPEVPRRPARVRDRHAADARGRHRDDPDPAQPARRPRPAARRDDRHGSLVGRRPARARPARRRRTRRSPARCSRACSGCSPAPTRPTSSPSSSRASSGTASPTSSRAAATPGSWRSRAAARSRTAACSACSWSARPGRPAGASASSTRRWSTSSAPGCTATSSCSARAAGGSRRSTNDRVTVSPAPGVPGKLPFWHGDAVGRPLELGQAMGAFVGELEADLARGEKGRAVADRPPARDARPRRAGGRQPARLPRRRARGDRRAADRQADRRRALPRRAGRLAAVPADPVRWPGPRAVVAGARGAHRGAARDGGPDDLVGRRDRDPAARGRRADRRHRGAALPRARRARGPRRRPARDVGAVRQPVPRERGARAAAAATPARDADAALAAAPAGGRPARGRVALRLVPDPRRDLSRVPVGRLRPAGPARDPGRRRPARDRGPRRRDRRAPRRSRAA